MLKKLEMHVYGRLYFQFTMPRNEVDVELDTCDNCLEIKDKLEAGKLHARLILQTVPFVT